MEDTLRRGDLYHSLDGRPSWSKITFAVRGPSTGRREPRTSLDIFINGIEIEADYDNIPTESFGISAFLIHSHGLLQSNKLAIRPKGGRYFISDVKREVVSFLSDVTEENFNAHVKD
ncbi:hypothetical protein B0T16DRAFT_392663 [Cercophora newfieldiana]|uniref:Uncharacterized protein n=1 Tax=Cercophora newfieldiana TaxID=92897 RepID=A0AA40CMC7_9PEZI|nr:hypothetical protein B0T16DRAFT_392663 [Cercophora newfieldiana]